MLGVGGLVGGAARPGEVRQDAVAAALAGVGVDRAVAAAGRLVLGRAGVGNPGAEAAAVVRAEVEEVDDAVLAECTFGAGTILSHAVDAADAEGWIRLVGGIGVEVGILDGVAGVGGVEVRRIVGRVEGCVPRIRSAARAGQKNDAEEGRAHHAEGWDGGGPLSIRGR